MTAMSQLDERQLRVLELARSTPPLSKRRIAAMSGVGKSTVGRWLDRWSAEGLLCRPEPDDTTPSDGPERTVPLSMALESSTPDDVAMLHRQPARRAVAPLTHGGRVVGMTKGQFSLLDLIRALLERIGPANVWLSTWTAGIRDVRNAALLLDAGTILSLTLLVDRSFAARQPKYCAAVRRVFGDESIRCTKTHAKIALLRNEAWDVAVRSSMNLNRNPRFEQYDIDSNAAICGFFQAHFDEMSSEMPPGPRVASAEVDAVFDRVARGLDPFTDVDRAWLRDAGAPLGADAPTFSAWVRGKLAEHRKAGRSLRSVPGLAAMVGVDSRALRTKLQRAPREWRALAEDCAARLLEHGEVDRR